MFRFSNKFVCPLDPAFSAQQQRPDSLHQRAAARRFSALFPLLLDDRNHLKTFNYFLNYKFDKNGLFSALKLAMSNRQLVTVARIVSVAMRTRQNRIF